KPENIMVTDEGIKLLDLGAARQYTLGHSLKMTAILTPGYAPLEQYQQSGKYGPYTDIYAVGGVIYYMITGNRPMDATSRVNNMNEPADEITDGDISEVVRKCMKTNANERYQNCDEFLKDIKGNASKMNMVKPRGMNYFQKPINAISNKQVERFKKRYGELPEAAKRAKFH
ncbi:protein kinase domain-containing protein, partial [Mesoaciditoga lauensis]|uniref:serine/threonine protein kinase n=1 Tax=Mesoaciditoga lauensis TaxID=1495039 RepID=UPI0005648B3E